MSQNATARARFREDDLLPALIFIALAALALVTPVHNDTWWHLRSGQEMWRTGTWLFTEAFSHTAHGNALHNHWWLSQLIFLLMYTFGGPLLLTAFAGACACSAVVGSWRLMRGTWSLRAGLLAWLVVATAPEWSVRPQVISLALLVLTAHLVVRDRLVWLPVLCLVWANAHALVVLGVAVGGVVALEALVWTRSDVKRGVAIAAACAAAPLVSPLGWSYWPQVLSTVSVSRALQIQEYRMPLTLAEWPFWVAVAALVALAVARRDTLRDWSRGDRILLLAAGVLATAAAMAVRNVAFFAVIAAPVLSWLWPFRDAATRRFTRPAGEAAWGLALVALLAGIVAVTVQWRGGGASVGWQPISPATIAAVRRCPDPIFNEMADGGILMWALPERRVFIDSRMEAYPVDLLQRSREADLHGDYRDLFRDHEIGCAIVTTDSSLHRRLAHDPDMELVHSGSRRTVFRGAGHGR